MTMTINDWMYICRLDDLPLSGARVVRIEGRPDIALFRTIDDRVFALHDRCPHKGGPLSQGIVHGARVTCPLHAWVINLDSGCVVEPDVGATACLRVRRDGDHVYLHRSDALRRAAVVAEAETCETS
jgi:nitrite reductase (NADH) small subunit